MAILIMTSSITTLLIMIILITVNMGDITIITLLFTEFTYK
jgi:hypothetical protein